MADNPYALPDNIDDDLWKNPSGVGLSGAHASFADHAQAAEFHVATNDGARCDSCGEVHVVPKGLSALPKQLHGLTAKLLSGFEHGSIATINEQNAPESLRIMSSMVSFTKDAQFRGMTAPLSRALAEVLDEMTDGAVSKKVEFYHTERDLSVSHTILKTINDFVEAVRSTNGESVIRADRVFFQVMGHMLSYFQAVVAKAVTEYRQACEKFDRPIDDELIANGHYTKDSEGEQGIEHFNTVYLARLKDLVS